MKSTLILGGGLALALATSCSSGGGAGGSPSPDGGSPDATAACGGSGDPCCHGTACNAGLTCTAGTCSAPAGSEGGPDASSSASDSGPDAGSSSGGSDAGADSPVADAGGVDAGPQPPSCQVPGAGRTDCGGGSESCCTSAQVLGGAFARTYTISDGGVVMGSASDLATIDTFGLDKYDVTVGRFRPFVAAVTGSSKWLPVAGAGKHGHLNGGQGLLDVSNDAGTSYETGWIAADGASIQPTAAHLTSCPISTWTPSPGTQESLPVNCVNWYEAYAFCIWDGGGFLPSEAEWEYAAAGGNQLREYPWGSTDPGSTSQYEIYGCWYNGTGGMSCSGTQNIGPVGTPALGAARWGQLDMAGNVNQWTMDWYATYVTPCTDCAYLMPGASGGRMVRGGNFILNSEPVPWRSQTNLPGTRDESVGFRCARSP